MKLNDICACAAFCMVELDAEEEFFRDARRRRMCTQAEEEGEDNDEVRWVVWGSLQEPLEVFST